MSSDIEKYVRKCQDGDTSAFDVLYTTHIDRIYKYVGYRVKDKETVHDLVSDTFMKALSSIHRLREQAKFSSWLYAIAGRLVIDHYRSQGKKQHVSLDDILDIAGDDDTSTQAKHSLDYANIHTEFKKLSDTEQQVILLRIWDELTYKEIADILGKSEGSAKMLFSRSLKKIRERLPDALVLLALLDMHV